MKKLLYILLFVPLIGFSQSWVQVGQDIDGEENGDRCGYSVVLNSSGSVLAIGANLNDANGNSSGHVRLFENNNGVWTQIGNDIDGESEGDESGRSIALSSDGKIVAIGAPYNSSLFYGNGQVKIFENISNEWYQLGEDILGNYNSGISVSLSSDGNIIAVGSNSQVIVYHWDSNSWMQLGNIIEGEDIGDEFGHSISLNESGNILAVGAKENNVNGSGSGQTKVFEFFNNQWIQLGNTIYGEQSGDKSGCSVSINNDGNVLAIGAFRNTSNGLDAGEVKIFEYSSGSWTQLGQSIQGNTYDQSGYSVSISGDGNKVAIGAPSGTYNGTARIYQYENNHWAQMGSNLVCPGGMSGKSISMSKNGNFVAVGSPYYPFNEWTGSVRFFGFGGCTNIFGSNYDSLATVDDGSCLFPGCTDITAVNYDSLANDDDSSCISQEQFTLDSLNNIIDEATTSLSSLQHALDTWNTTINLSAGWNMFGYGCPTSIDLAEGLSNHTESIIITKDNNGNVYMPEFGFNGVGDLIPGAGYQMKLNQPIDSFSLCDWYVNDIPEDNIVSLQDSIDILNSEILDLELDLECVNQGACSFNIALNECVFAQEGYDCDGGLIIQIGVEAYGGIVFYVDETGQHGLVSAMEDLPGNYYWGCFGVELDGADGQAIGTGLQNTLEIEAGCSATPIAASEALAYESEGYSDWFLPSKDELVEMYNTIGGSCNIGGFESDWYWSSSENGDSDAWDVNFYDGSTSNYNRYDSFRVRVIRSF